MENIKYMQICIIIILIFLVSSVGIIGASNQVQITCGGNNQVKIMCLGKSDLSLLSTLPIKTNTIPSGGFIEKPNNSYTYWLGGLLSLILLIYLLFFLYNNNKKKKIKNK
jgi:hypothetical protein